MAFFLETLIGGLMAGMLYSLVALGFVLIYKASVVFNFCLFFLYRFLFNQLLLLFLKRLWVKHVVLRRNLLVNFFLIHS